MKKDTFKLHKHEVQLVQHYKKYLQKLERVTCIIRKKAGSTTVHSEVRTRSTVVLLMLLLF